MVSTFALLMVLSCGQAPDDVQDLLKSKTYGVTWNEPDVPDSQTILEIGTGSGHGLSMHWLRFQPGPVHVEVFAVEFQEERKPYTSKWPPDNTPVTVKRGLITKPAYDVLLQKIAWLHSAKLVQRKLKNSDGSSADFWVSVHATWKMVSLIDLDWAGYQTSSDEYLYAVPRAIGVLAAKATKNADFKKYELTAADREWARGRFEHDWKRSDQQSSHWWVRERLLVIIGYVGNDAVLPTLKKLLQDPPKSESSDARCVYHAINAVTRLTKKDVRTQPVESMDLKENRLKVLELLTQKP